MPTHELRRSGEPPVVVDGDLISQSATPGGASDRRFELVAILRAKPGPPRYVIGISYLPPPQRARETAQHWVLLANGAADIGPVLRDWRVENPIADMLTQVPAGEQFAAKTAHLVARIDAELRAAITDLVARIPGTETRL